MTDGCRPTLRDVFGKMKEDIEFKGKIMSFRTLVKKQGEKHQENIKEDIRRKRVQFLRQITSYMQEGRPILMKHILCSLHTTPFEWANDSNLGLKKPILKER